MNRSWYENWLRKKASLEGDCSWDTSLPAGQPDRPGPPLRRRPGQVSAWHALADGLSEPASTQRRAFDLIGVPIPLTFK
jgi:hypothetical protein